MCNQSYDVISRIRNRDLHHMFHGNMTTTQKIHTTLKISRAKQTPRVCATYECDKKNLKKQIQPRYKLKC